MKHLPRSGRPITMSTWRTPIRPAIPAEGGGTEVGSGFSDVGLSRCSWLFTYTSLSAPELSTRGLGSMALSLSFSSHRCSEFGNLLKEFYGALPSLPCCLLFLSVAKQRLNAWRSSYAEKNS